jgi:hypothetical protein
MHAFITRNTAGWMTGALLALMAGCGGGSEAPGAAPLGQPPPELTCVDPPEGLMTSLPEGVFVGALEGSPDEGFLLATHEGDLERSTGGRLIHWKGLEATPRPTGVTTFAPGYSCSENDTRASNGSDWPGGPRVVVGLTTLEPATNSVEGTVRYLDAVPANRRFASGPIPGSSYDPLAKPVLAYIVGDWPMTDDTGQALQLSVASDGTIVGSYRGCTFTGNVSPGSGSNQFRVHAPATGCVGVYGDLSGFAIAMPMNSGETQLLFWAESNGGFMEFRYLLALGRR